MVGAVEERSATTIECHADAGIGAHEGKQPETTTLSVTYREDREPVGGREEGNAGLGQIAGKHHAIRFWRRQ